MSHYGVHPNAACESFLKTLKREEIYASDYRDMEQLAVGIEQFIERYYNRCRLHSALSYRSAPVRGRPKLMEPYERTKFHQTCRVILLAVNRRLGLGNTAFA